MSTFNKQLPAYVRRGQWRNSHMQQRTVLHCYLAIAKMNTADKTSGNAAQANANSFSPTRHGINPL
jgi:hypothetical protein